MPIARIATAVTDATLDADRRWIAASVTGVLAYLIDLGLQILAGTADHHPAIDQAPDAAQHRIDVAAHPDRDRPLDGKRIDASVRDGVPPALEVHQVTRPQRPQHLDLLLDPLAAIVEVLA